MSKINKQSKYRLLTDLLPLLDSFEEQEHENEIEALGHWLIHHARKKQNRSPEIDFEKEEKISKHFNTEIEIGTTLTALFKYTKLYAKKVFEGSPIRTLDEFGFLASLTVEKSLSKTELVTQNLIELPSGNEIIKRLVRQKLIEEFPDPYDKRAKQVQLTDKGRKTIFALFNQMNNVAQIVCGNSTEEEKEKLLFLLQKLNYFHKNIHQHDKQSSIETIIEKYIR